MKVTYIVNKVSREVEVDDTYYTKVLSRQLSPLLSKWMQTLMAHIPYLLVADDESNSTTYEFIIEDNHLTNMVLNMLEMVSVPPLRYIYDTYDTDELDLRGYDPDGKYDYSQYNWFCIFMDAAYRGLEMKYLDDEGIENTIYTLGEYVLDNLPEWQVNE